MSIGDVVSFFVIFAALFVAGLCAIKARRYTNSTRTMFNAAAVTLLLVAGMYSMVVSGVITLQSVIDIPILRTLFLCVILITGALAIAYDHQTH